MRYTPQEHTVFIAVRALGANHNQIGFLFLGKTDNHLGWPAGFDKTANLGGAMLHGQFLGVVHHLLGVL